MSEKTAAPKARILCVDDEAINLKLLRVTLSSSGYEILEAHDGREALLKVDEENPDIMLLDIMMPGIDGFEVCQRIRAHPKHQGLPILMLTALNQLEDRVRALDSGADDFVTKPFNRVELIARVQSLLRVKNLHDRLEERSHQLQDANRQLQVVNRELTSRNRELEMGLEMAHKLQEALLPQNYPALPGVTFCHKYMPADAVGGDFFEILPAGENQAAVFVCDVSGHGVRAALVTSVIKTLFEDIFPFARDPADMLCQINERFRTVLGTLVPQIYCTAFYMIVEAPSRTIRAACAAHCSPFYLDRTAGQVETLVPEESIAPAIGIRPDFNVDVVERTARPGDVVLGFTDGLFEVHNRRGEEYGIERMAGVLRDNFRSFPRELIQKLISDTESFMGGENRPDDVCLVAAEFTD
jgi:sigma-B regulation protein RsbU (phosphoserine phosphatase)